MLLESGVGELLISGRDGVGRRWSSCSGEGSSPTIEDSSMEGTKSGEEEYAKSEGERARAREVYIIKGNST